MRTIIAVLVWSGLLRVQLPADTVFSYVATTASMRTAIETIIGTIGVSETAAASAPGFVFSGGIQGNLPMPFQVGQQVPLDTTFFGFEPFDSGATVDFGGIVQPTNNLAGTFQILTSPSSFVILPNANPTYTFAATATGQIVATPMACMAPGEPIPSPGPGSEPICGTSAVLSIDLPGTLTVQLIQFPSGVINVNEVFASAPVPEPSSAALLFVATGLGGALLLGQRRKLRIKRGQTL